MWKRYVFIDQRVINITQPPAWNNGIVESNIQLADNKFSNEAGRNAEVHTAWVADGRLEEIYWYGPAVPGVLLPAQRFYVGGNILTDGVVSLIEDTDYVMTSIWESRLPDGGDWCMTVLMTDRDYPAEFFDGYTPYMGSGDFN